jgi:hypothetical protein
MAFWSAWRWMLLEGAGIEWEEAGDWRP